MKVQVSLIAEADDTHDFWDVVGSIKKLMDSANEKNENIKLTVKSIATESGYMTISTMPGAE